MSLRDIFKSNHTKFLEAENARLQAETVQLRKENSALRGNSSFIHGPYEVCSICQNTVARYTRNSEGKVVCANHG